MRPEILTPLFKNITSLNGIGPKLNQLFIKLLNNEKIISLLWHMPRDFIFRKKIENLDTNDLEKNIIVKVKILKHDIFFKGKIFIVKCECKKIPLDIYYFSRTAITFIKKLYPINNEIIISGKLEEYKNKFQIKHPEIFPNIKKTDDINSIQPLYSLTKGLTQKIFYKSLISSLKLIPDLNEWIDKDVLKKYKFLSWKESLISIHKPINKDDLTQNEINRKRLAYDELLAHQLSLNIIRINNRKSLGIKFNINNNVKYFINELPFDLTNSQKIAIKEIEKDLISNYQMIRLLQGDVGSGKTIISIIAMLHAFKSGYQSSIMAPTEILANQHFETIKKFLESDNIRVLFLSGRDTLKNKKVKIDKISKHQVDIIVGTHALIQENVNFNKLGLVIIDEQHRFGVHERLAFTHKGVKPNILVMTATPIPRTLTIAAYGEMEESRLTEKPKGRVKIETSAMPLNKIDKLIIGIKRIIQNNEKIYWVCPMIEESEEIDLQAANKRFEKLEKIFSNKVLLLHGKLKPKEKDEIMNKFKNEHYNILVSTTIIEVGIDIPNATNIIIEHAERFGLAQLHQLRGRVGRSNMKSNCILLYNNNLSEIAKKRIKTIKETDDGFKIAENDLEIRGPGEVLGKKQSGFPNFLIADFDYDKDIFEDIQIKIKKLSINKLDNKENIKYKNLLYLFEKDIALKTLKSG